MAMNVCPKCGYKVISKAMFERHLRTHDVDIPAPTEEVPPSEPAKEDEIVIRFTKPVEIKINGVPYVGKEIRVKDMSLASELVRIAREGYGPTILL